MWPSLNQGGAREGSACAVLSTVLWAIVAAISTWPWAMFAAVFGLLSLLTLWYLNFLKPRRERRKLAYATKTYFLIPARQLHGCEYAVQDEQEHITSELSISPNTTLTLDLVTYVSIPISFAELIVGFLGDVSKKPKVTKYYNRYVSIGKGREVDPAEEKEDDYIDKHGYYHRRVPRHFSGGVLSSAFTITTQSEGLYPLHIYFVSERPIEDRSSSFITVERIPTVKLLCCERDHKHLDCSKGGLRWPSMNGHPELPGRSAGAEVVLLREPSAGSQEQRP